MTRSIWGWILPPMQPTSLMTVVSPDDVCGVENGGIGIAVGGGDGGALQALGANQLKRRRKASSQKEVSVSTQVVRLSGNVNKSLSSFPHW